MEQLAALLERLEAAWRTQGAPIVDSLQPGLSGGEIDALMAPTGLELPTELRTWWGWHNGAGEFHTLGPGAWIFISLEVALEVRAYNLSSMSRSPDPVVLPDAYWRPTWLPITHGYGGRNETLFVDVVRPPEEACPVRSQPWMWEDVMVDRSSSFTEVVELWVTLLEVGTCRWDPAQEHWERDWNAIPLELRQSGLL